MYQLPTPTAWRTLREGVLAATMSREVWQQQRLQGVGATEAVAVCGLSKWTTPLLAWQRRKGLAPRPEYNTAMHMGHLLEPIVAKLWEEHTGLQIAPESEGDILVYAEDATPWRICSPDRWTADGVLVECKTTAQPVNADNPPVEWVLQLQYQMAVCGATEGWLAWLVNGRDFGTVRFERDDALLDSVLPIVDGYWLNNVLGDVEPAISNVDDALLKFPSPVEEEMEASDTLMAKIAELKELKRMAKEAEAIAAEVEAEVKMQVAQTGRVTYKGSTLLTYTRNKPSVKLDSKRLQAEHPDLCAGYMVEVEGARVLRIK